MTTRLLFLLTLTLGGAVFLKIAWPSQSAVLPSSHQVDFVAQPGQLPVEADGNRLLQQAIENLASTQSGWMRTNIRQCVADRHARFVVQGFLQRGPNQCARLEMNIDAGGRLLVVSDGVIIAQVRENASGSPKVKTEDLPENADARNKLLDRCGAGGPLMLLQELAEKMRDVRIQTGTLQGRGVIQVKGNLEPGARSICTSVPVQSAIVYLDAKTLWPTRLEWWASDSREPVVCFEFLDPDLDHALSDEECARLFSYQE